MVVTPSLEIFKRQIDGALRDIVYGGLNIGLELIGLLQPKRFYDSTERSWDRYKQTVDIYEETNAGKGWAL